jgi:ech hydrogenase subunit A
VAIGFMSLLLPPFGAFIGKWFSIETLGQLAITQKALGAFVIVLIAFGGAVLSLLYFKVLGLIISKRGDYEKVQFEKTSPFYSISLYILLGLVIAGVLGFPLLLREYFIPVASQAMGQEIIMTTAGWNMQIGQMNLPIIPLVIAFLLLPVTIVLAMFVRFKNVDRVKEYACGEKVNYSFSALYFSTDKATPYFTAIGILFFVALLVVVMI